jgi:hypothetical protein
MINMHQFKKVKKGLINETKCCLCEKTNIIDKPLAAMVKKKEGTSTLHQLQERKQRVLGCWRAWSQPLHRQCGNTELAPGPGLWPDFFYLASISLHICK